MANSILTNIGLKAMAAQFAGLQTTGNNIANASVAGYSRQQVQLSTSTGQSSNGAFYGMGVDVASVTRMHDAHLSSEAANTASLAAMDSTRLAQLTGLESAFQPGENGLGAASSQFFKAMVDVSSNPGDLSSRRVALARASDLAARFREAGQSLDSLQTGVATELTATVTEINGLARDIATVNQKLALTRGQSQPANDLLDQRDQLVARLSSKIHVDRIDSIDGSTAITVAGGQPLVLGSQAAALAVVHDANDPSRSALALVAGGASQPLDEDTLGGGSVAGLLQFQNQDLVQGRNLVGRLAASIGMAINAQQASGISLQPPLGQVNGSPFFAIGGPVAVPKAGNARDAAGLPLGSVSMAVTDPSALQASDYALQADPSGGTWQLTRLADHVVRTINSGDVVDGLRITINNAQSRDQFLLQPVRNAAATMKALLTDPRDVAAASPLVATTAAGNVGTVKVSSLQVTSVPLPTPGGSVQLTFKDDQGGYDWTLLDASSNAIGGGSGTWQTGQPLPPAGTDFNGYTLQIEGVPRQGDVITVAPTSASGLVTNNGNALSLMALRDANLVDGRNATDGYAQAMADVGVRVQSGKTTSAISTAVAQQAETNRSSVTGVNLDEEGARLIQYQQGYQAAAKVLSVAQSIFDTMLQAVAR